MGTLYKGNNYIRIVNNHKSYFSKFCSHESIPYNNEKKANMKSIQVLLSISDSRALLFQEIGELALLPIITLWSSIELLASVCCSGVLYSQDSSERPTIFLNIFAVPGPNPA
jgi:hypothetical protein